MQVCQRLAVMGEQRTTVDDQRLVDPQLEQPPRGDRRVKLAQAARGKFAGWRREAFALFHLR